MNHQSFQKSPANLLGLAVIVGLELALALLLLAGTGALAQEGADPAPGTASDYAHSSPAATAAITLTRGPYLQSVTTDSVVVAWETDTPASSRADYGPTAAYGLVVSSTTPITHHALILTNLNPHAFYHYQVSSDGQVLGGDDSFRAAASSTQTAFSFVAFGDTRTDAAAHRTVVDRIVALSPEFVLHTGDFVANGSIAAQWDTFFSVEQDLLRQAPLFGALGNHEVNSTNYFDAFHLPGNERWYSFDYGNAHFIALQIDGYADYAPGSAQYAWLEDDLASTDRLWKIVFFHIPPHSSGSHGGDSAVRDALGPLFAQYGVDLVFNGHDHDYERSIVGDVVYIVTGGGGAPLRGQGNSHPYTVYFTSTYHCVSLTISGRSLSSAGVRPDGTPFDAFTLQKDYVLYLPLVLRAHAPVRADFTAQPTAGIAPLTVAFTNTSAGAYTASLWAFGDGITSTVQHPTHVYPTPGAYTVTLTASGPGDTDTLIRTNQVTVSEARALWVSRFDWTSPSDPATPAAIDTIVDKAATARFNVLLFQVRGTADALYTPGLEPWSGHLNSAGELGYDPGWDPLATMIDRAHTAGLQVHAYVNVYPTWAEETPPISATVPVHPFWTWSWWPNTGWSDWRHWDQDGPMLLNPNYLWASPGAPPVSDHVVAVAIDIATRYDVDGIHLDYVRYAGSQYSCDPFSQDRFGDTCFSPGWEDWQRAQVTDLVQRIHQALPPGVMLSAAVWPVYVDRWGWGVAGGREDYYQDSQAWTEAGIVEALYPMLYYWGTDRFETLVGDFQAHAAGQSILPGIGAGYADFGDIVTRIQIARAHKTTGYAIFSYGLVDQKDYWDDFVAPGGPHADE